MNIQSIVITFAVLFLSMFQSNASEIRQCRDVLAGKNVVNYRFATNKSDVHSYGQTPRNLNIKPTHSWIDGADYNKVEHYNKSLFNPNRPRLPLRGGQRGLDASEQWLHYYHEMMPDILSGLLQKNYQQLSPELRQFMIQLLQVTQMGVEIQMLPESSGKFKHDHEHHRVAMTTGRLGDPIYLNQNFFSIIGSHQIIKNDKKEDGKSPFTVRIERPLENNKMLSQYQQRMKDVQAFKILIHELGHYLNIKDDVDRILDQYASEISKMFEQHIQDYVVNFENQEHLKLSVLNFKNGIFEQQLLISDFLMVIEMNDKIQTHLQKELGTEIQKISFKDISWEKSHDWDAHVWSQTTALMFTAEVQLIHGKIQDVRLRIVIEPTIHEQDSGTYSAKLGNMNEAPLTLLNHGEFIRIGIQTRKEKSDLSQARASIEKALNHQTELKSGEKWTTSFIVKLENANDAISAHVEISSDQLHWSGVFKKQKIKAQKTWIEPISSNQVWVHMEHTFPVNQVEMKYLVDQVVIAHKDHTFSKLRPQIKQTVLQLGQKPSAKLIAYGNRQTYVEPMNQAKVRKDFGEVYRPNVYVPLTFVLQQNSAIQRAELSITVVYEADQTGTVVEGFVVNLLKQSASEFVGDSNSIQMNSINPHFGVNPNIPLNLYTFAFALPERINGKKVEKIEIENVYFLFKNMDQIFEPVVNTLFIQQ